MDFDHRKLQELVTQGLVSKQKHPQYDLYIYNYTPQCVYSSAWNEITLACRGLILDGNGETVARPFPKFFNIEEHSRSDIVFSKPFQAFEKMDGSLGILYPVPSDRCPWRIATRGSFASDQAFMGTAMLNDFPGWEPHPDYTYLFEIIYPQNRIVVNYGDRSELVFLAAVHKETGANVFEFGDKYDWPGAVAPRHEVTLHPRDLNTLERENAEGFVLFFPHKNTRVKVKFEEYKRLHKIVTGTNTKTVWQSLMNGDSFGDLLDRVPDEFHDWLTKTVDDFKMRYAAIETICQVAFEMVIGQIGKDYDPEPSPTAIALAPALRGEFARYAKKEKQPGILFSMLDGKNYSQQIWKMLKPAQATWFAQTPDEES